MERAGTTFNDELPLTSKFSSLTLSDFRHSSVAVASRQAALLLPPPTSSGKVPPMARLSRRSSSASAAEISTEQAKSTAPAATQPFSKDWVVKPEDLPPRPIFPLERSHCIVRRKSCSDIASTLAQALNQQSIEASFEGCSAKCSTENAVEFRINLFTDMDKATIVELQRRRGDCFAFKRCSKDLLNAAQDIKTEASPTLKPVHELECLKSVVVDDDAECDAALRAVANHLRSNRHDLQILALEKLCASTNPSQTRLSRVSYVSHTVLTGGLDDVREDLATCVDRDSFGDVSSGIARRLALLALSQMLPHHTPRDSWCSERLVPLLEAEVSRSSNDLNASLAAKCLAGLR